ncbi:hypothetical protein BDY19DRAFT_19963 [Irpex rosettiformis]|uniref:Uncharacterized protein n=1 Tax=Irpex rosettiformis TaxID=378272 RepID=A0ACB8UJV1_9APHY|nr:hypothetical protein BDY19DRAFT_19963 [Irpex rosettiformis]
MAPVIKFTSFSIPFLVEFANMTFRRRKRNARQANSTSTLYAMPSYNDSDWTFASLSSTDKIDKPAYAVIGSASESDDSESRYSQESAEEEPSVEGLWIQFASQIESPMPYSYPLSEKRLKRLRYRISKAVVAAGMESSPDMQTSDPFNNALQTQGRLPPVPVSSLYRGTYGQVMEALHAAGLVVSQCEETGFAGATFLGAMFVGRYTRSGLKLSKLSLWA